MADERGESAAVEQCASAAAGRRATPAGAAGPSAIVLDAADNVAVALRAVAPGDEVAVGGLVVLARAEIAAGHKLALRPVAEGERVLKYGEPIGIASAEIAAGEHVHVHNVRSARLPDPRQ